MAEHDAMMARFVHDYLELLDHRVSSIRSHLEQRNFMTAHVALLSLESTSVMVGAERPGPGGRAAARGRRAGRPGRRPGPAGRRRRRGGAHPGRARRSRARARQDQAV